MMIDLRKKKFVASYSGGKDSVFAIYKSLCAGLSPLELITAYNPEADRSWFHGLSENMLKKVSDSLDIQIKLIKTPGELYEENFEKALADAKERGAEVCVFGDIDIEGHLEWCGMRCKKAGLIPYFPLWKKDRGQIVHEFIDAGFSAVITIVNTERMSKDFVGQVLSREVAGEIEKSGADICGENGEYHTFVFDGPIFKNKIDLAEKNFKNFKKFEKDNYYILKIDYF
jgi:uncharacterized protein (TIGR00290 family)